MKEIENEVWGDAPEKYRVYDVKIYDKQTNTYKDMELTNYIKGFEGGVVNTTRAEIAAILQRFMKSNK